MLNSLIRYHLLFFLILGAFSQVNANEQSAFEFVKAQSNKTNPLYGYLVGPGTEKLDKPVLKPFSTDGCSQSPNGFREYQFVECCVAHDVAYWIGGTWDAKNRADQELALCIEKKANKTISQIYLKGVSVGGTAKGINTFRWGYGWDEVRDYRDLTPAEMAQAETMYGKNIYKLHEMLQEKSYEINLELLTLDMLNLNRSYDDELIYYFLQNNLKRIDQVTFGQKLFIDEGSFYYRIRLKSCGDSPVDFNIAHWSAWKKFVLYNVSIHSLPWSELAPFITDIRDPNGCLR